ncbi:SIR2 family protein [Brevibacillus antibioticus]|uniref:SIR2 family protein n=1 Tax=Brevibacillus antibioticus TaxID=2570228 RepID=A0A4U2YBK8_9BACL|nr:SIR2 family protein [Brevibacillus antibioticus]TKI58150.1 SIR2 family protein [Brevibacillus antibioticus]
MSIYLENLRQDYQDGKVIPFIGAGLSVPFNIPSWGDLIRSLAEKYAVGDLEFVKKAVEVDLNRHNYWGAIDALKNYTTVVEEDIQEEISNLIQKRQIKLEDDALHNYSDLGKMGFKFCLTTNYEHLLHQYMKFEIQPILLKDVLFNTQDMLDQKRVCHLHGTISNYGTIVISRESYQELYRNKKYDDLLKLVTGNRKLLFMGFSFDDQFISTLIKEHKESFNGKHYILLANPTDAKIKELRSEYGLLTIPYKTENSSHTAEIRKILNKIAEPLITHEVENPMNGNTPSATSIIIGAGLGNLKKNVSGNLFYRKLKLENIDESMIELSSAFYVASEEYIRELQKTGIALNVIEAMLAKVFIKYKERYVDTYKRYGKSEQFLLAVHNSLAELDFGRHALLLKGNKSDENENRGLIHLLADDEDIDVWWGEERLGSDSK